MKTIIKYELVINEALRSALNYNTPDEQINEFIRFFGRHIGSDRIYVFEDCKERHGTDNTYEWCAQGVIQMCIRDRESTMQKRLGRNFRRNIKI